MVLETRSFGLPQNAAESSQRKTCKLSDSGGKTTEPQVEQPKSGDPNAGQVGTKTKYVVQYGASGTQQTKTTQERDINGTLNVVFVETRKSDQVPAAQAQATPSEKPK
jgi:hypothetical protein